MISDTNVRRTFRFTLFPFFLIALSVPSAFASRDYVSSALPIALDETLRGEGHAAGEPDCFRLQVPSAGLLMLDLAVPESAGAEPRLALLGSGCGTDATRLSVIEHSATHLVSLSTSPQDVLICVGAQDPRLRLGAYKLRNAFQGFEPGCGFDKSTEPEPITVSRLRASGATEPEGLRTCLLPERSTEPEPIEVEPEGLRGGFLPENSEPEPIEVEPEGLRTCMFPERSTEPEPIEVEPEGLRGGFLPENSEPEPIEVEPEGLGGRGPLDALCNAGERDDHADALLCATPMALGRSIRGEMDNGWGDDHDVFSFELTAAGTVRVATAGEVDTFGGLYDRRGQRLAAAASGGEGANFRLVKALPPGLYFVRVEAEAWTEGSYSLGVDVLQASW